jgi:hypothetical protein
MAAGVGRGEAGEPGRDRRSVGEREESIFMVTALDYPRLEIGNVIPTGGNVPPRSEGEPGCVFRAWREESIFMVTALDHISLQPDKRT